MQISSATNLNTNSVQKPVIAVPTPDYEHIETDALFKESIQHYKERLEEAKPLPSDILTVDRINSLHKKNTAAISFLSDLYISLQEDQQKDLCVGFKSTLKAYMTKIQDFAQEWKKL